MVHVSAWIIRGWFWVGHCSIRSGIGISNQVRVAASRVPQRHRLVMVRVMLI